MDSGSGVAGRRAACAEPRRRALACLLTDRRLRVRWQHSVSSSNVLGKIIMGTDKTEIAASMLELIRYIVNVAHSAALAEKDGHFNDWSRIGAAESLTREPT